MLKGNKRECLMEEYKKLFVNVFELNDAEVENVEKMEYGNNGKWDSLRQLKLLAKVEDVFQISMKREDLLAFRSYEIGLQILRKYLTDQESKNGK